MYLNCVFTEEKKRTHNINQWICRKINYSLNAKKRKLDEHYFFCIFNHHLCLDTPQNEHFFLLFAWSKCCQTQRISFEWGSISILALIFQLFSSNLIINFNNHQFLTVFPYFLLFDFCVLRIRDFWINATCFTKKTHLNEKTQSKREEEKKSQKKKKDKQMRAFDLSALQFGKATMVSCYCYCVNHSCYLSNCCRFESICYRIYLLVQLHCFVHCFLLMFSLSCYACVVANIEIEIWIGHDANVITHICCCRFFPYVIEFHSRLLN